MTQPSRLRAAARACRDLLSHVGDPAADQGFACAADAGPPVDVQVPVHPGEGAVCVEHHEDVVGAVREAPGDQAARRDVQRAPGPGQADRVLGSQRLDAANPGDHPQLEADRSPGQHLAQHVHGAVVDRRVAPGQERAVPVAAELAGDQLLVDPGAPGAPVRHEPARRGPRGRPGSAAVTIRQEGLPTYRAQTSWRNSRSSRAASPLSIMNTTSTALRVLIACTVMCSGWPAPIPTTDTVLTGAARS